MPRARSRAAGFALAWALPALAGCGSSQDGPRSTPDFESPRTWTSQHFRYLSRAHDDGVCEAVLEQLERHFETLQRYLGFSWPEQQRIDYYKFADVTDLRAHGTCSAHNAACFYAGVGVQAADALQAHELVHAYLAPLGRRHLLLEEGLAIALSCGHEVSLRPEAPPWSDAFALESWTSNTVLGYRSLYQAAGWFVGWLTSTHGPEAFMRWYERLLPDAELSEVEGSFREVFSDELEASWRAAFDSADPDAGCLRVWECAQPDWFETPIPSGCEHLPPQRSLTLDADGWVIQRSSGFGLMLGSCADTPEVPHQSWLRPLVDGQQGELFALGLEAGRYFVSQSPRFDTGSIELFNFDTELPCRTSEAAQGLGRPDECSEMVPLRLDFRSEVTFAFHSSVLERRASDDGEVLLQWSEQDPKGNSYEVACSTAARQTDALKDSEDTASTASNASHVSWCSDCGRCAAACGTDVSLTSDGMSGATRSLLLIPQVDGPIWVRLRRTF